VTPRSTIGEACVLSDTDEQLTATDAGRCTNGCTSNGENANAAPLDGRPEVDTAAPLDADLVAIVEAWPTLPVAVKAGMLAMVAAAKVSGDR
jgi:hypothetical protein